MGTVPLDSALGADPVVGVHPGTEEPRLRAAPSLGDGQQGFLEEEWTGPLLIEEEEEDGSEGEGVRTRPAVGDQPGPAEEEEPSSAFTVWHPKGGLGEPCANSGDSLAPKSLSPVTKGVCYKAGLAAEEEEEGPQSTSRQERPLAEEAGGRELVCLLASEAHRQAAPSCCVQAEEVAGEEQECPICTEPYDQAHRKPAVLNCSHVLCGRCLQAILEAAGAADIGRVRCPICRQKTPMMEWEICKLQEELLLLSTAPAPTTLPPAFSPLPPRQPGFWGGLEYHFQARFHTSRVMGFLPCLRYPACLIGGLARLARRCHWCYRVALLALAVAEMLSLLLVFLPILLLMLLFLILEK